jgi:hypothetical protein
MPQCTNPTFIVAIDNVVAASRRAMAPMLRLATSEHHSSRFDAGAMRPFTTGARVR